MWSSVFAGWTAPQCNKVDNTVLKHLCVRYNHNHMYTCTIMHNNIMQVQKYSKILGYLCLKEATCAWVSQTLKYQYTLLELWYLYKYVYVLLLTLLNSSLLPYNPHYHHSPSRHINSFSLHFHQLLATTCKKDTESNELESACTSVAILICWYMDREKAKLYFKEEVQRYQLVYTQNLEKDTISDIMITSEGENRTTVRRPIHERCLC